MSLKVRHAVALIAVLVGAGCERQRRPAPVYAPRTAEQALPWTGADAGLLVTPEVHSRTLKLAGTRRYPQCWEQLERDEKPLDPFPFSDRFERAEHLASCGFEALAVLGDGSTAIAWGGQEEPASRARDLRLGVWASDGSLQFWATLDRSRQAPNWAANFRRSFITELADHVCYGTLWEGDTQVSCIARKSGKAVWTGSLPFWAGIEPQPAEKGLVVADLSAVTQRYPFDGSEMRHRKLDGLGGRAGYYASDGKRLYFVPSRTEVPPLIAYDIETFEEAWRMELPAAPAPALEAAYPEFERVVLEIDNSLYAVDTEEHRVAWAYDVGDDVPSLAHDARTLYVLSRRADGPNLLVALDPRTGERKWSAETPTGTLRIAVIDGVLLLGTVRAVQRVILDDE